MSRSGALASQADVHSTTAWAVKIGRRRGFSDGVERAYERTGETSGGWDTPRCGPR